ncbi:MAG: 4-hydroxy-tetrahydrodipicolinate reductase [Clostridiales bacterium]|nr:4-hydroxy-tetrahydrodipicolinate reductase [Clostridiales bacterium]
MISVLINGICGQMGRAVYAAIQAQSGAFSAVAGVDPFDCSASYSCPVYKSLDEVQEKADVIIDFSVPATTPDILRYALEQKIPVVIGTTGLGERELKLIRSASDAIPVFQTGNMSLGVNLQLELVQLAAATLGGNFDVEIIETHHRKKVDSPSGTALMLANAIASISPEDEEFVFGRHEKNKRRSDREIGIHSVRGGTVVGEHQVQFIGNDEIIEVSHRAFSKAVFAQGALRAAKFLVAKESGLYNMKNVVTEHDAASRLFSLDEQAAVIIRSFAKEDAFASRVFDVIAEHGVFVDMIACSEPDEQSLSIGFSLNESSLSEALNAINELTRNGYGYTIRTRGDLTKLTLEGTGMALQHGVASQLFSTLRKENIHIWLITTSETRIEFCVDTVHAVRAADAIRQRFSIG